MPPLAADDKKSDCYEAETRRLHKVIITISSAAAAVW
ncbi:MAG: hypothetical protein ACI9P5_004737 [Saprospiraceae bacterium]|jgi:hypothetical protein